jgi:hypothetical protein
MQKIPGMTSNTELSGNSFRSLLLVIHFEFSERIRDIFVALRYL